MAFTVQNNFDAFKKSFEKEFNMKWNERPELFLAFYNARVNDQGAQFSAFLVQQMAELIDIMRNKKS